MPVLVPSHSTNVTNTQNLKGKGHGLQHGVINFHGHNFQFRQVLPPFLPIILRNGIMPTIEHKTFMGVIIASGRGELSIKSVN